MELKAALNPKQAIDDALEASEGKQINLVHKIYHKVRHVPESVDLIPILLSNNDDNLLKELLGKVATTHGLTERLNEKAAMALEARGWSTMGETFKHILQKSQDHDRDWTEYSGWLYQPGSYSQFFVRSSKALPQLNNRLDMLKRFTSLIPAEVIEHIQFEEARLIVEKMIETGRKPWFIPPKALKSKDLHAKPGDVDDGGGESFWTRILALFASVCDSKKVKEGGENAQEWSRLQNKFVSVAGNWENDKALGDLVNSFNRLNTTQRAMLQKMREKLVDERSRIFNKSIRDTNKEIREQIKELEKGTRVAPPEVHTRLPGVKIPGHPKVTKFLTGVETKLVYSAEESKGAFNGVQGARKLAQEVCAQTEGRCSAKASGSGAKARVTIKELQTERWKQYQKDLATIRELQKKVKANTAKLRKRGISTQGQESEPAAKKAKR